MWNMTKLSNNFTGNIDDLLNHCASVDDNTIDQALELERAIEHVMSELDMNREEAMETIQHIHLMEVQQTVNSMMEKGLLRIFCTGLAASHLAETQPTGAPVSAFN